jgi:cell division protein FtsI/penicillin-binding protein 2
MNQSVFKRRVYVTGIAFAVLTILFIIRLVSLHFSTKIVLSENNKAHMHRGYIRDKNGYILALSVERNSLFANPEEIENPEHVARLLSYQLRIPEKAIEEKLKKKKKFIWIRRKLDNDHADRIQKLGIKGLYFKKEYKRVYPHDSLAANIVGFVGVDNNGLAGIEYNFDDALSGRLEGPQDRGDGDFGYDIVLTIDHYIQYCAEQEIKKAVELNRAKQGVVAVVEVATGRILALAKYPTYNPNYFYRYPAFSLRNFSVIDSFEPGSTMKIISLVSMLEHHPAIMKNYYYCKGYIDIADTRINCTGVHGRVNMNDIIRYSCNVGVIEAMKSVTKKEFYDTLLEFGFGRKTGVEMPAETEGILRDLNKWSGLSKYSISIGQEISVTSLQLAAAYCAIANGGVYLAPTILESIKNREGDDIYRYEPKKKRRIVSRSICASAMKMMRGVVASGTGKLAASDYYCVAGKTGTSQKFIRAKGYSDRVLSSFVGLAPCSDPAVCVLVVIDDPADKLSGGQIATPVFSGIIDRVLFHLGVKKQRISAKFPVAKKNRMLPSFDGVTMPDFSGMRLPDALALLVDMKRRMAVSYSIHGSGRVYGQVPAPGSGIKTGREIILYMREY